MDLGEGKSQRPVPRLGVCLALLWDLQKDIAILLILIGLRGGDGKTNCAVQFHHRQFCHLAHGGFALLHTDEKVHIRLFKAVGYGVIPLKSAVADNERLLREYVALQHIHQCTDFVFLGLWLND